MKNTRVALLFLLSTIFVFPGLGECAEPSAYDASLPADVATNADLAYAVLAKSAAAMPIARKNDLALNIEKLSGHKTRDDVYQKLRKEEGIIPLLVVSYKEPSNIGIRVDLLGLIMQTCRTKDYKEVISFLKKECYLRDNGLRTTAINAVAGIIRLGRGFRGRKAWLEEEDSLDGIRFLALLANTKNDPYPVWQREAGEQLFKMGFDYLLPTNMVADIKSGPSL